MKIFLHFINKTIRNNFLKETIIYGLMGHFQIFLFFLVVPIYTRYLSVDEFGILDLYLTISMLIYIILEM